MRIIGCASASTLPTCGSSADCGRRLRTRATRSRTSAAASSGSLERPKRIVIWLRSLREMLVSTCTPSMPAIESSSGLVTWLSMTSELAPARRVETVTTGSSMRGYSRTVSCW
jgi:hypothetical protein